MCCAQERLDNLAFTSFPEDYLPYAATPGHPRTSAPPPYLLWGDDRRRRPPKKRRKPKCAGALLCAIALVVLAILAVVAISVYLGVVTNLFRSPVVTVSGRFLASEEFAEELLNSSSTKFLEKVEIYQSKVEKAFLSSSLEPAFIAARVYSFRPGLVVFFRVYLDRRKIKQNGEESPPTELVRELVAEKLAVDPESVHTEESEELTAVELRPVEPNRPAILKKPIPSKPPVSSSTQQNGQRLPPSGGVGVWRPIPIEDTVSPSFADRPIIGAGSVQSPEENSRRNPSAGVLTDNPAKNPPLSAVNSEGVGSVKVSENLPGRNPPLNTREGTGSVRLLEEPPLRNVQSVPQSPTGAVGGSKETGRRPLVPTDRREGVYSVRLSAESHPDTSQSFRPGTGSVRLADVSPQVPSKPTSRPGTGSVRLADVSPQVPPKPTSNVGGTGSVRILDDSPPKTLPSQRSPLVNEGVVDPPTLAPSVMLVVRNRSRSDKPRNLLPRLEKMHQNTGLGRSENIGVGSVKELKEIIAESLPVPFKREPPVISSRLLDLDPEVTMKSDSNEQLTEVTGNNHEITSLNVSTDTFLGNQNRSQFFNKKDLKLVAGGSGQHDTSNIPSTEVSQDIFINTTKSQDSKTTVESIIFSHPPQSSFAVTETSLRDEASTERAIFDSSNTTSNEMDKLDATNENKSDSTEMSTAEIEFSNENKSSATTKSTDEDIHSSIVNYSQYMFTEPHFHTIEKETDASSEDPYEVHTLMGHGFFKPSNSSNDVAPSNLKWPDSTTEFSIISSVTTSGEIHTSSDFNLTMQTVSPPKVSNQSEPPTESPVRDTPEIYNNTPVTNENTLSDSETKVTEVYDNTSDSSENVFSNVDIINTTTDDGSQQAKVVPQMQSDLLSNDIEEESVDENNHFGNEILKHITTLRPQLNGSDSFLQSCPAGSVPCDAAGESCGVRCDMRKDCPNNEDEIDCRCSDLLRAMGQAQKICDGIEDCSDKSDEDNCPWCPSADYFRCPGSRTCITKDRVCDGKDDCPGSQDERRCVNLAESSAGADSYDYRSEGYLIVRRSGQWGKLCLDALTRSADMERRINDLGKAVCSALTYRNMSSSVHAQDKFETENSYYQISTESANNKSSTSSLFEPTSCKRKEVLRVQCKTLECGLRPSAPPSQRRRIVGGRSADSAGSWPWAAALYREGDFQCGAALISDIWLVSAAHCFYSSQQAHWTARLGVLRRGSELPTIYEQVRRIKDIILHPEYEDEGFINDIVLLRMDQAVPFSDTLRPICLPSSPSEDASLWHGRSCSVVGWGKLYEIGHTFPDSLQEVRLPVISSSECQRRSIFLPAYRITPNMFCAGFDRGGRDACLGDSGGPMACQRPADGRWILLGVTSNGDGCGRPGRPGVYSQVAGFLTWIQDVTSDGTDFEGENTGSESTCPSGVRCRLGRCIPQSRVCDGRRDCAGGEDEMHC